MLGAKWKMNKGPVPQSVVQMIPIDRGGRVLVMHRSDKVRSARNVWSFPSGMHEIGHAQDYECARELLEEYSLVADRVRLLGVYENIAGDPEPNVEQYHWVISLYGVLVYDLDKFVNNEPEKHDRTTIVSMYDLVQPVFYDTYPFHSSFDVWARPNRTRIYDGLQKLLNGIE